MKRTTVSINGDTRLRLERLAVNATIKAGRSISWTDIVHYLIENYADDAAKDLAHSTSHQSELKKS